jgi:hypothetical protein
VGLSPLVCAPVELAEADVAVGEERTHSELRSKIECFPVAVLGVRGIRRVATRGNLPEQRYAHA